MSDIACPVCGAANEAANRFCGACGASLSTGRAAWKALLELGRPDEAEPYREGAAALVRAQSAATPDGLRERFLARPDVADLTG